MRKFLCCSSRVLGIGLLVISTARAQVPSLLNYQGRLLDGAALANGEVALSLRLFDHQTGGNLIYEDSNSVTIVDGLYSTVLGDKTTFGSLAEALTNSHVWIEAMVNGIPLSPRERLASVPYALHAWGLSGNIGTVTGSHFLGTTDYQPLEIRVNSRRAALITPSDSAPNVAVGGQDNAIAGGTRGASILGGSNNLIAIESDGSTIGAGARNSIGRNSLYAVIAGGLANTINSNASSSGIGGGRYNFVDQNAWATAIAGGVSNRVGGLATHGVIGGGEGCTIGTSSHHAVVGGGLNNAIGSYAAFNAIGGGELNSVGSNAQYSTVVGGYINRLQNTWYSTIAGGRGNVVGDMSDSCFIAGGYQNGISNNASYAFVAGRGARALHPGAFVWGGSQTGQVVSTAGDQVTFRCEGGVRFVNSDGTLSAAWAPGALSWTFVSDRAAKENIEPVDANDILEKVLALPINQWNYTGYSQRHIGPMAQDFHAAFPLNENDRTIDSGDLPGIALAAIQSLAADDSRQTAQIASQKTEIESLRAENAALQQAFNELKKRVDRLSGYPSDASESDASGSLLNNK